MIKWTGKEECKKMEIKYVYRHSPLGRNWHVVIDGDELFYPCGELKLLRDFVKENLDIILEQIDDTENNYGLAFYACGYDGQAQTNFVNYWEKKGLNIF